ncbi:MAG: HAMP domain-containing sensor histidine kinase [Methylococcales bacterium]|nr:HAMP domain-containing sensor histidine kinase [Methylococcales bacterium]MDP3009070.1 HAMP domain-containing sensor histidine kinase [Methylococcales bacterium]
MNALPDAIQQYLHSIWTENDKFAYLNFDAHGLIKHWHYHIDYFGLTDLHSGDPAAEQLIFLEGLLPYQDKDPIIIESVNFANGVAADIHILPADNDIYVLFFDVSERVTQRQAVQQERHTIDLLYQQQHKNIELLKQTYQELDVKKQQAETANKEKSQLLSYITHDLRTPLTAILGFAQFLEADIFGELTDKQRDCIVKMLAAGKHMDNLINDILDAAQLEAGNIALQPEPLAVRVALADCIAWLQPIAEQQHITLINRVPNEVSIQADAKRFKQVMINLLHNAIKYNREHGCIVITGKVLATSLRIRIKDTGIGIAAQQLDTIFQPFTRVLDKDKAKKIQGHGVGLSECKHLIGLMQGSLSVRSELSVGSVFYIELPLAIAYQDKQEERHHQLVYWYQDLSNMELFGNLLTACNNVQLFGCNHAEQAVQLCTQHAATVLLIDINSEQLAADIAQVQVLQRQLNQLRMIAVVAKQTPAVAMQQILQQTQIDDYLTCPFDFNQVLDMLE